LATSGDNNSITIIGVAITTEQIAVLKAMIRPYIMPFTIFIPGIQPNTMKDNLNLNGFPTDNLPSTQLKYDIVASKFMTGIHNHHKLNAPVSLSNDVGLIDTVYNN